MQHAIVGPLVDYPILTLFVVIGLGYVLGELNIFGFRLGVAGVLFVGLAIGALNPRIALPEAIGSLGLIIFVYTIGIQSGPSFFSSFREKGYRDSLFAAAMLGFGALLVLALSYVLPIPASRAAGLFCGALTNTPALAAARDLVRDTSRRQNLPPEQARRLSDEPTVAYSVAYPVGVIGVLLCFQLLRRLWGASFEPVPEAPDILARNFVVRNPGVAGRTVADVMRPHRDPGFIISRIHYEGQTSLVKADTILAEGSIVVAVGDEEALERASQIFGQPSFGHIEVDRSEFDYRRFYVSSKEVVGRCIRELDLQERLSATITRLRRGDVDIVATADTRLEFGDQVRVLTRSQNFPAVARFLGDSIRGTAETDFGSVAVGMVLGVIVGMTPLPVPGGATMTLGLAGGPLIVALVLGNFERTGRLNWRIPASANLTLRQIGLLLFLAGVGTRAGYSFFVTFADQGLVLLASGAVITFGVTLATMFIGYKVLRLPFDSLMGLMSGLQTQPACLAFACNMAKSESPNLTYAGVYPTAMIVKIVLAQLLVTLAK
jgi:putative transport protein